jgi:hypothetical protein
MGEENKLRFGVLWGKGKNQISDLGKDVLLKERKKKKILDFEQDVLWWEGGKSNFRFGKDGCIIGEGKKNQILGLGNDVYYMGKEKMYYDARRFFELENRCALAHMVFKFLSTLVFRT